MNNPIRLKDDWFDPDKDTHMIVTRDTQCQGAIHELTRYPREGIDEKLIKEDSIVKFKNEWSNMYGNYIRVTKDGKWYDLLRTDLALAIPFRVDINFETEDADSTKSQISYQFYLIRTYSHVVKVMYEELEVLDIWIHKDDKSTPEILFNTMGFLDQHDIQFFSEFITNLLVEKGKKILAGQLHRWKMDYNLLINQHGSKR